MKKFILLDPADNTATALSDLAAGFELTDPLLPEKVVCRQKIPMGHKVAVKDIEKGAAAVKYGSPIGVTSAAIRAGEHVHVHNLQSRRGKEKAGD